MQRTPAAPLASTLARAMLEIGRSAPDLAGHACESTPLHLARDAAVAGDAALLAPPLPPLLLHDDPRVGANALYAMAPPPGVADAAYVEGPFALSEESKALVGVLFVDGDNVSSLQVLKIRARLRAIGALMIMGKNVSHIVV